VGVDRLRAHRLTHPGIERDELPALRNHLRLTLRRPDNGQTNTAPQIVHVGAGGNLKPPVMSATFAAHSNVRCALLRRGGRRHCRDRATCGTRHREPNRLRHGTSAGRLGFPDLMDAAIALPFRRDWHVEAPLVAALSAAQGDSDSVALEMRPRHERHSCRLLTGGTRHRKPLTVFNGVWHAKSTMSSDRVCLVCPVEDILPRNGWMDRDKPGHACFFRGTDEITFGYNGLRCRSGWPSASQRGDVPNLPLENGNAFPSQRLRDS
jgi:hypothetical protein